MNSNIFYKLNERIDDLDKIKYNCTFTYVADEINHIRILVITLYEANCITTKEYSELRNKITKINVSNKRTEHNINDFSEYINKLIKELATHE